jgi:glycosyltransferase involved in cell wall biosynthesis
MKVAWVVPEERGGIRSYAEALAPAIGAALARAGGSLVLDRPTLAKRSGIRSSVRALRDLGAEIVHVQHEYGLFGGKNPPGYTFPAWIASLRREIPGVRVIATAHTVLPRGYRFPLAHRGIQAPLRWAANRLALPWLARTWNAATWGALDGVIVHSALQEEIVRGAGCSRIAVIPHFVAASSARWSPPAGEANAHAGAARRLLVFGFLAPSKGQDLAIEALANLPKEVRLVLAGEARREADRAYAERCRRRIAELGLGERVAITGFVEVEDVDALYRDLDLVLAPFRETTGSGSLAQALARGAPVLASDLPLNREVEARAPGSLAFFRAGDPNDLARRIVELLEDRAARADLGAAALRYAALHAPEPTAERHAAFYRSIVEGR